nr:hypothetical protein [Tanacetum cinerariifolium]
MAEGFEMDEYAKLQKPVIIAVFRPYQSCSNIGNQKSTLHEPRRRTNEESSYHQITSKRQPSALRANMIYN